MKLREISDAPIAAASLAQVYKATTANNATVAVKVLLRGATTEKDINEYVSRRANRDTLSHGPTSHFFRALYPQLPEGARPYLDPATPVRRRAPRRVHDAAQPVHRPRVRLPRCATVGRR